MKYSLNGLVVSMVFFLTVNSLKINAQDLEPRSLSATPIHGNFALINYSYSNGNILLDGALPIEDLTAKVNSLVVAYAHSFKLLNKLAKFDAVVPYSFAKFNGEVKQRDSSVSRNGFGDPSWRISIILIGVKPMNLANFMKTKQEKFKLGVSFRTRMPLGQYNPEKLLNLGTNRWAFKFGTAGSYTFFEKLILEGHLDLWVFTKNNNFLNGNTLKQNPLFAPQVHVTYVFKPGIWCTGSFGRTAFGETVLNGAPKDDPQDNSRVGLTFAYKLNKNSSLKFMYSNGVITRYGENLKSLLVTYQYGWFNKN